MLKKTVAVAALTFASLFSMAGAANAADIVYIGAYDSYSKCNSVGKSYVRGTYMYTDHSCQRHVRDGRVVYQLFLTKIF